MPQSVSYQMVVSQITRDYPKFKTFPKASSRFMKFLNVLLTIGSFGTSKGFMDNVTTTIGYTVYTPKAWESWSTISKVEILRHESIHMKQRTKLGWFLFFFLYLFFPLPILFAYYRTKFEQEAYEESLKNLSEYYGVDVLDSPELKQKMVSHFTSGQYLWMWVIKSQVEAWYDRTVDKLKENYKEE